MRIAMIGAGYVGLVSGACFSQFGFDVTCVDNNPAIIERLKAGEISIYEPGLAQLVSANQEAQRLLFTSALDQAVRGADVVFIAVGTPARRGDGAADLKYVEDAARAIAPNISAFKTIVIKSTVPVGTARHIEALIRQTNPEADFEMASNPEFLREGSAIEDFMHPDRVVIGVDGERARDMLTRIYRPLQLRDAPLVFTSLETSELAKYAANAFLAMKVTYINQMADLCEALGADVQDVARAMGLDKRIGADFLSPGPGYGGSCFPKDTRALAAMARAVQSPLSLVDAVIVANKQRKKTMANRIISRMGGDIAGKRIAVLGVSFKPDTDDMRKAPSLRIIPELMARGAHIALCDPAARANAKTRFEGAEWHDDAYAAAEGADCVVIITEWNEFRALDLARLAGVMAQPLLIDLRNIYRREDISGTGFTYHSIGRAPVLAG